MSPGQLSSLIDAQYLRNLHFVALVWFCCCFGCCFRQESEPVSVSPHWCDSSLSRGRGEKHKAILPKHWWAKHWKEKGAQIFRLCLRDLTVVFLRRLQKAWMQFPSSTTYATISWGNCRGQHSQVQWIRLTRKTTSVIMTFFLPFPFHGY